MLLFFIKLYFFALLLTTSSIYATDEYSDAYDSTDPLTEEQIQQPVPAEEHPAIPDSTQATPEAPAPPPAAAAPDTSVPNSQLKWPDTSELQETTTDIVPASATTAINAVYDKTHQAVTSINTAIAEMLEKRKNLYSEFFTQNTAADDFIQDQQVTIGSLVELFNPSDKKKE